MLIIRSLYYIFRFPTLAMPLKLLIPAVMVIGFIYQMINNYHPRRRYTLLITSIIMLVVAEIVAYLVPSLNLSQDTYNHILTIIMLGLCLLIGCLVAIIGRGRRKE